MTREEFEGRIEFDTYDTEHSDMLITGEFLITAEMTVAKQFKHDRKITDAARKTIIERLWHTVYEVRRKLLMDKFMALRMVSFPTDGEAYRKTVDEIYELLKGL